MVGRRVFERWKKEKKTNRRETFSAWMMVKSSPLSSYELLSEEIERCRLGGIERCDGAEQYRMMVWLA